MFDSKTCIFKHLKEDEPSLWFRLWRLFITLLAPYQHTWCTDHSHLVCRVPGLYCLYSCRNLSKYSHFNLWGNISITMSVHTFPFTHCENQSKLDFSYTNFDLSSESLNVRFPTKILTWSWNDWITTLSTDWKCSRTMVRDKRRQCTDTRCRRVCVCFLGGLTMKDFLTFTHLLGVFSKMVMVRT